jgi:hypothetical protein
MSDDERFEVVESSWLTDADWTEINKLQRVYKEGGKKALNEAMGALAKDPIRFVRVVGAFFPDMIRKTVRDALEQILIRRDHNRLRRRSSDTLWR